MLSSHFLQTAEGSLVYILARKKIQKKSNFAEKDYVNENE